MFACLPVYYPALPHVLTMAMHCALLTFSCLWWLFGS